VAIFFQASEIVEPALFQFQLSLAQPPKKFSHGRGSGESDLCDASISGDDRVELRAVRCQSGNDRLGVRGAIKIGDDRLRRASYEALFSLSRALGKTVLSCRVGKPTSDRDVVPSLSEKIREESVKFALHCPLDWEGHRLGTFRSYHCRVRQIQALVHSTGWQLFGTRPCVVVSRTPLSSSLSKHVIYE